MQPWRNMARLQLIGVSDDDDPARLTNRIDHTVAYFAALNHTGLPREEAR
jgi:hypothetical protein